MKRIKTSIFTLILASASLLVYSQDMGGFSDSDDTNDFLDSSGDANNFSNSSNGEDDANPFADALDSDMAVVLKDGRSDPNISAFLAKKGWVRGLNDNGRYVGVGSSTVSGTTSDPNYNRNRIIAFNKAMLDLKASIVESFAAEVTTLAESILSSPNSSEDVSLRASEAQVDPMFLTELTNASQERIDAVMANGEVATRQEAADMVISSESFKSLVAAYAREKVGGLIVAKILEENTKITVIAYYSNNSMELASVLNGTHSDFKVAKNTGVQPAEWVDSLSRSGIYPCLGVFASSDKDGNLVLLSFGQAVARSESPTSLKVAYENANLNALGYLRNFAGELVTKSSVSFTSQALAEFKDGQELSINEDALDSRIRAYSDSLAISGANTIREWSLKDPRNGQVVCGTVKMWSIKTSQYSNFNRELMKAATQNRGGYLSVIPKGLAKKNSAKGSSSGNAPAIRSTTTRTYENTRLSSPETQDF